MPGQYFYTLSLEEILNPSQSYNIFLYLTSSELIK